MSVKPPNPPCVPLTDVMELTGRDGEPWVVYVEAIPSRRPQRWRSAPELLPDRRLRFDSASESRVLVPVPAGSPFLADRRLQELLDRAAPLDATTPTAQPPVRRATLPSAAKAVGIGAGVVATAALTEGARRWRRVQERQRTLRYRVEGGIVSATERVGAWLAQLLRATRRARF